MLSLFGFPISNYYNKIKLAQFEKGLWFTAALRSLVGTRDTVLPRIPRIRAPQGGR